MTAATERAERELSDKLISIYAVLAVARSVLDSMGAESVPPCLETQELEAESLTDMLADEELTASRS
jgi:hypothetical protein